MHGVRVRLLSGYQLDGWISIKTKCFCVSRATFSWIKICQNLEINLSFQVMARFAYLKSCYERLGHFRITQVLSKTVLTIALKFITAIATNIGGTR